MRRERRQRTFSLCPGLSYLLRNVVLGKIHSLDGWHEFQRLSPYGAGPAGRRHGVPKTKPLAAGRPEETPHGNRVAGLCWSGFSRLEAHGPPSPCPFGGRGREDGSVHACSALLRFQPARVSVNAAVA